MTKDLNTKKAKLTITKQAQVIVAVAALLIVGGFFVYKHFAGPEYQPITACQLFSPEEAISLLGDEVVSSSIGPVIKDKIATSKCSYTNGQKNNGQMSVAAVAVRHALSPTAVSQNKSQFETNLSVKTSKAVDGFGSQAFLDTTRGQLNILNDDTWIIVSYARGAIAPSGTVTEQLKQLANLVIT